MASLKQRIINLLTGHGFAADEQDVQRAIWREQKAKQRRAWDISDITERSVIGYLETNRMVRSDPNRTNSTKSTQ